MPQSMPQPMSQSMSRFMSQSDYPRAIYLESTTRCNMRCSMCVKQAPGSRIGDADLALAAFRNLRTSLPHAQGLVLNGIGEPLLHPYLVDMVAFARRHMPEQAHIGFQSNGLLLRQDLADRLSAAGLDVVCLSVDAVDTTRDGSLHGAGNHLAQVSRAMDQLLRAGHAASRPLQLGVEFVLMRETAAQLPAVIRWAAEHGASFVLVSQVLAYEANGAPQSLFNPNSAEATRLFRTWQATALAQGLDMHDYFAILFKYDKSPEERRLVDLVRAMHAQAGELGIGLNLRGLLHQDRYGGPDTDREIFAEAETLARGLGLELELPGRHAALEGCCGFLEQGSVFIDAHGNVTPCHFLWHRYPCHMDGVTKQVWPRHFGNIATQPLEEIWRSAEYRAFREEAMAGHYPSCSNCNVVPCSDLLCEDSPFQSDCLGSTVPCGHCPWSMDMLKCLELPRRSAA